MSARRCISRCIWYCWPSQRKPEPARNKETNTTKAYEAIRRPRRLPRTGRLPLDQLVTDAPYGLDFRGRAAQLVPQPGDVHIHRARITVEIGAPNQLP